MLQVRTMTESDGLWGLLIILCRFDNIRVVNIIGLLITESQRRALSHRHGDRFSDKKNYQLCNQLGNRGNYQKLFFLQIRLAQKNYKRAESAI